MRRRVVALLAGAAMTVASVVLIAPQVAATAAVVCSAPAWAEGHT
jgi:hypothetical protein